LSDGLALTNENTPRIMARKYALVLRPEQHQPHWLVMKLRASDFRVAVTNRACEVVGAVDRMPWLSLLIADGSPGDSQFSDALRQVREKHPELPILWLRADEAAADETPWGIEKATQTGTHTAYTGRREIIEKAETLLSRRFYPAFMVDAVSESILETLLDGYRTEAEFISVSLKLTRNTLGEIIPVLPFSGPGVSGHLVLDAPEGQLRRIHERVFSRKEPSTLHSLGDLGGEILNQTLGRLKAKLGRFGVPIELGLPLVVMGKEVSLRSRRAAPALLFDFNAFGGRHLFFEFSLTTMDLTGAHAPTDTDNLVAGELSFL
jgi:CheY-specific phosphatase CheX